MLGMFDLKESSREAKERLIKDLESKIATDLKKELIEKDELIETLRKDLERVNNELAELKKTVKIYGDAVCWLDHSSCAYGFPCGQFDLRPSTCSRCFKAKTRLEEIETLMRSEEEIEEDVLNGREKIELANLISEAGDKIVIDNDNDPESEKEYLILQAAMGIIRDDDRLNIELIKPSAPSGL